MAVDERPVDRVPLDQLLRKTIEDSEIRAWSDRKVHLRLPRRVGPARIDHDRARRVGAAQPVELVHPQHRLRLRGVDPDMKDRVAVLQIVDTVRLTVATERLLQRLARRRRAQPCVAVQVVCPDPPTRHERKRVVVLEEELAARVEPQRPTTHRIEQPPRTVNDKIHCLIPTGSTSSPSRRTSGRSRRSEELFACQPYRPFGPRRP